MEERKLKIALIGAGRIAVGSYLPALIDMKDVELQTVLCSHEDKARDVARRYGFQTAARSLDELMKAGPDCVFLLTPKSVRWTYLEPLMKAGVDVYCEKPLAMTLDECERIANAAQGARGLAMIGFNRRFTPYLREGLSAFGARAPQLVVAQKCREKRDYRATLENAIHMIDFLRFALGECEQVEAQARWESDPFREDLCTAQLGFANGSVGMLCASRTAGQWHERVEMFGPDEAGQNLSVFVDVPDRLRVIRADHEECKRMAPLHGGSPRAADSIGFTDCIRYFLRCVRTRETPMTNPADAYKTHLLLHRILQKAGLPDLNTPDGGR